MNKTFANRQRNAKFAKVFSCERNPLYGILPTKVKASTQEMLMDGKTSIKIIHLGQCVIHSNDSGVVRIL